VLQEFPDMFDDSLLCPIRFEMAFVDTFLEALRRTKFSISRHRQAVGAYRVAREQSEVASFKNALTVSAGAGELMPAEPARIVQNNAEAEKQRQRLQKLRLAAVQAQMAARRDINGVLALELQRFRSERTARIAKAFDDYVRVQRTQGERIEAIWKSVGFPAIQAPAAFLSSATRLNDQEQDGISNGASNAPMLSEQDAMNNSTMEMLPKPPSRRPSQLRAKYPFQGENEDELDVNEGDVLVGKEDEANPEWIRAKSLVTGKEGLVPRTYVEEIDGDTTQLADDEDYDSHDEQGDSSGLPQPPNGPTNYIKQTQDMFNKGTKRTNEDREQF
jgi:Variant SH3 domain